MLKFLWNVSGNDAFSIRVPAIRAAIASVSALLWLPMRMLVPRKASIFAGDHSISAVSI